MTKKAIETFKTEINQELISLLDWWINYSQDHKNEGFYGKIANNNSVDETAPKGLVLNARILYTFSSAYALTKRPSDLAMATRAYDYLIDYFLDLKEGGFYWSVNFDGSKLDDKKQMYGQAFAIYAFAEYYKTTGNENALNIAKSTFVLLEKYSFDRENYGYLEALTNNWEEINDLRLSEKDQNEKKSMNTHLHIIEAYANLHAVWPDPKLKTAVKQLLSNFKNYIIDPKSNHLHLFFNEIWEVKSTLVSFGHDIEAAWLLQEAAEIIADEQEIAIFKTHALQMAIATEKGLAEDGGLFYEYDPLTNHWIKEFHWWPQAEAMVGFLNAFQLNGDERFLIHALKSWSFIKNKLKNKQDGEWFWGITKDHKIMLNEDKAGFWKCPYHNGRACLEVMKRLAD